jgi:hypothetical protein
MTNHETILRLNVEMFREQGAVFATCFILRCLTGASSNIAAFEKVTLVSNIVFLTLKRIPNLASNLTFRRRIKSRLPFAGIIRSLPYSTGF